MMKIIIKIGRVLKRILIALKCNVKLLFQIETLENFIANSEATSLVFTHTMGGGTEQYVKNNYDDGGFLLVRKLVSFSHDLYFSVEDTLQKKILYIKSKDVEKLFTKTFQTLIINSVCHYADVFRIIDLSIKAKNENVEMNMLYLLHDFHCICPNQNLFTDGFYCNLQCEKHKCKYSISEWRNAWLKFLEKCDEIRCFSESSKEILRFAYKTLNVEKITIVPHDMSFSKFTPINVKNKKVPVYGVVGVCKIEIKGNKVMQTILKQVPENIRFVFVGTKKSQLKNNRKNVIFLGKYRHDELQEILEKENVTHIIFPSVVPETFSYVVSEIMQMNLPIMCFNIGAQAEKVSKYEKGIVCESVDEMVKKVKNG